MSKNWNGSDTVKKFWRFRIVIVFVESRKGLIVEDICGPELLIRTKTIIWLKINREVYLKLFFETKDLYFSKKFLTFTMQNKLAIASKNVLKNIKLLEFWLFQR